MSASSAVSTPTPPTGDIKLITLSPAFKLVFLSVLGITISSMILGCTLAMFVAPVLPGESASSGRAPVAPSDEMKAVFQLCLTTWKLGFGAIIGLLGGKAL
jgi:hypothetical protein